ncbi:11719_t:CDS:2, partial [Ambispora gerdemannii]
FTYFNAFKENGEEDIFDIDQVSFASARVLLNDDDNDVDWTEIEVEDSDLYESFLTMHDHCDDTSDALRDIRKWLISIAESSDLNLQEGLLALITPTLIILNKADQNSPEIETTNLPSKLIVRIALKMGKDKAMKERTYVITPEKASKMVGDQNSVNQPLFGESSITNNLLVIYETILNTMLETRINNFGMEDVHSEIIKQVPVVRNTLPTNVVILKPGDPPNCNENVYAACEIYCGDLPRGDRLYIACDQAIFA